MVGLPGSGKTTWAENHASKHPNMRYVIMSPERVLDAMRVLSLRVPEVRRALAKKRRYLQADPGVMSLDKGQMEDDDTDERDQIEQYYGLAVHTYKQLLDLVLERPRNVILDQTHLTVATRMERTQRFKAAGFTCKAALAAPLPFYLQLMQNESQQQGARPVPDEVVAKMMAEFTAPLGNGQEGFTEVHLVHEPPDVISRKPSSAGGGGEMPMDTRGEDTPEQQVARVARQVVARQRDLAQRWLRNLRSPSPSPQTDIAAAIAPETKAAGTAAVGVDVSSLKLGKSTQAELIELLEKNPTLAHRILQSVAQHISTPAAQ